jgi:hypothetical protein
MIEKRDKVKQYSISAVLCSRRSSKFGDVHCIIITTAMTTEEKKKAELFVSDYYFLPSSQLLDYITIETHSYIFIFMKHISPPLSLSLLFIFIYMGGRNRTKEKKFSIFKIVSL